MAEERESREPGLLPRGWARVLLVLAMILLGLAYWVGITAEGPDWDSPGPVEVEGAAPPEPQPE